MVTIDFIVKRHGEKEKGRGVVSSTRPDIVVPLSDRGREEEFGWGKKHIPGPPHYAHIILIYSDYLCAEETVDQNMLGAGYDYYDGQKVTMMIRSDIGLGVNNHARSAHSEMPLYGHEKKVLDAYVRTLFKKFWHPRPGNPPCLAAYAAAMLDAVAYGIERTKGMPLPDDARVLVEIVTHCPVIDVAAAVFSGGKSLEQGAFQTGEFFTGRYEEPAREQLTFEIKGEEYNLMQLQNIPRVEIILKNKKREYARDARTIVP